MGTLLSAGLAGVIADVSSGLVEFKETVAFEHALILIQEILPITFQTVLGVGADSALGTASVQLDNDLRVSG